MKQFVLNVRNGEARLHEVPSKAPGANQVLVRNTISVVSAGTERAVSEFSEKSLLGKALARPDLVRQVWQKVKTEGVLKTARASFAKLDTPLALGYSSCGVVLAVGANITELKAGDRVACAGMGFASHAETVVVPKNLCVKVPDGVESEAAAFTTLGAIALQGLRLADLRLGEKVVVIGLGLIGLLTVQLLRASGCTVLGVDIDAARISLALDLGANQGAWADDAMKTAEEMTGGRGADAVIVTAATASNAPTELAGELSRHKGRVVFVGDVKMDIPRRTYYKKEIEVKVSMSYGPGRYDPDYEGKGIDYPYAYVPFTEQRNMEAFLSLVNEGKVTPERLITHRYMLDQAEEAYKLVQGNAGESYIGVVFKYPTKVDLTDRIVLQEKPAAIAADRLVAGVIGAGNYARQVVIPILKGLEVNFAGISTATGISGHHTGEKYGFEYCTTDYRNVLADERINTIFIATRHNMHAEIAAEALQAGKHVFLEKPLAVNDQELMMLANAAQNSAHHFVGGFNRRFAPLAIKAKEFFHRRSQPLCMIYRINAGFIAPDHWTQDNTEGGGRIIGEICHFIDFLQYLCGAEPDTVYACGARSQSVSPRENVSITISYKDGSVGSIHYFANGDKSLAKEYIEIFGDAKVFRIEDFCRGWATSAGKTRKLGAGVQDKGQVQLLKAFRNAILDGGSSPVPLAEMLLSTYVSFRVEESLRAGVPLKL